MTMNTAVVNLIALFMVLMFATKVGQHMIDSHYDDRREDRKAALMKKLSEEESKRWEILSKTLGAPLKDDISQERGEGQEEE